MNTLLDNVDTEEVAALAFERVQADMAGLQVEELLQVNVDVPSAVATILGVLPEVREVRPRIERELPAFDLGAMDKLEDYARALAHAQTLFLTATQPPDDLEALAQEAPELRERLLLDARALAGHGLIGQGQLAQLRGANGYKNVAEDLRVLSQVLEASWPQIEGKLGSTRDDLARANRMSMRLLRIVGLREQGPAEVATAAEQRMRAFTLVFRAYEEEIRRAVGYLRAREGDADTIAPSLYPGRPRRRQSEASGADAAPGGASTGTPAGVAGTPAGVAGAPAAGAQAASPTAPAGSAAVASKGPFLS